MKQNETIVKTPQQKALEQAGVTAEAVEKLRATAKTVKITSPDDRVGYAAVDRARIDCKNLRNRYYGVHKKRYDYFDGRIWHEYPERVECTADTIEKQRNCIKYKRHNTDDPEDWCGYLYCENDITDTCNMNDNMPLIQYKPGDSR